MVSSTRRAFAGVLVIFSAAVFVRAQTVQPKDPTATITGKVTIKGKGVSGILVGLRRQHSSTQELISFKATTDSEGKYRIENVEAGPYFVIPIAAAYISEETNFDRILNVNKGETIENVDFVLVRGGAITGRVVDAAGNPLIEEQVYALAEGGVTRYSPRPLSARTDDRGIYRLFGLPKGRYRIAAGKQASTYGDRGVSYKQTFHPDVPDITQATVIDVTEGSEANNVDIFLRAPLTAFTVSGRIVDGQTGEPMPNATYRWTHYFGNNNSRATISGPRTTSSGEFRLEGVTPGKYSVTAQDLSAGQWHAEEVPVEVIDQDVTGLVIRTEKAGAISGVVVLEGTDDKGAREQLYKMRLNASVPSENSLRSVGSHTTPGPDGSFRITGLAGGTAWFSISSSLQLKIARVERNGAIQPRGIEIRPGEQVTGVRVIVHYGNASIHGSVVIENGPMPTNGSIFVWMRKLGEDPNAPSMAGRTTALQLDARGQFVGGNLLPGNYEIIAGVTLPQEPKNFATKRQEVVVTAGSITRVSITLDLKPPTPNP
jgi:hypothetical protein